MSFSDLPRRGSGPGTASFGQQQQRTSIVQGDFQQVGDALVSYERLCIRVKEMVSDMRRRKVGLSEKQDLDSQIRNMKDHEIKLKSQLDALGRQTDSLPKNEVAARRIAVGKLMKDYDRVRALAQVQINEVSLIKVTSAAGVGDGGVGQGSVFRVNGGRGGPADFNIGDAASPSEGKLAIPKLIQTLQGQDVEDMILEERERDIKKMNQDLMLVHEMFQDMANIVEQQGEMIEEISDMTEKSHDRAKAGLEQVKQAAAYQPTCAIS